MPKLLNLINEGSKRNEHLKQMEKLFNESEMISNKRPTEVGERKQNEFFLKMAKEAIANGWLDSSYILDGVKALKEADYNQDAYELSKDLEDTFNVDANFVD